MPTPGYPTVGYIRARSDLRRHMGKANPVFEALDLGSMETVHLFDDFLGDTINTDLYATAANGTASAAFTITATRDGVIAATSGTDDNGCCSIFSAGTWYGDAKAGMECRLKVDAVTQLHLEVGFADAVPGSNTGAVNDIDTPTAYATDMAVLAMDTDQTLKTLAFVTAGTAFTTTATTLSSPTLPTAGTYMTVRVQLVGNSAECWVDGKRVASHQGDYIEGGNPLGLWVYCQARSASAARVPSVDYFRAWQDRNI